jgi:Trp operon repressor
MSINHKKLNSRQREIILEALFSSAKEIHKNNSVEYFINTLLTESEQITIGRRILIAQMILAGKTQSEISYLLNVSPNTFTRTRKWLNKQIPNYNDALKEYQKEHSAKSSNPTKNKKIYVDPVSFKGLRKKFPMHFLLFNIAEELITKLSK